MSQRPLADPLDDTIGRGGVPRDRWDRALLVPPGGGDRVPYTSVSTLAGALADDWNLNRWDRRMIAKGVGMSRELAALAGSSTYSTGLGEEDEARNREEGRILDDVVERARDLAKAHQKRDWGSAFHRYTEEDDPLGEPPEEMVFDIEAFRAALAKAGIRILATEVFIVCEELKAAGTFDHLVIAPWMERPRILDKKTGRFKPEQDMIQLAIYAGGEVYDRDTDERRSFAEVYGMEVDREVGYTAHSPALQRRTDLFPHDLEAGYEAARLAVAAREHNKRYSYRKKTTLPLDLDAIGAEIVERELDILEAGPLDFEDIQRELRELHKAHKDIWRSEWTQRGGALLRSRRAAA